MLPEFYEDPWIAECYINFVTWVTTQHKLNSLASYILDHCSSSIFNSQRNSAGTLCVKNDFDP